MRQKSFMLDLLEEVNLEGMSHVLGGTADPQDTINNGSECVAINGDKRCDVINSGTKCLLINQQKKCSIINTTVGCNN